MPDRPTEFPNGINISGMNFPVGFLDGISPNEQYYVHSGDGSSGNDGLIATDALDSIVNAVLAASTNKHTIIWLLPGHVETISAAGGLGFNKADITIFFLGTGANRAQIKFDTSTSADIDIDAAGITFIRPRFVVDIDALVGGIDVNAADFTMIEVEDYDTAGKAATDMVIASAAAIRLKILGYKYFESTTGTQKESRLQIAAAPDITLENIDIVGDFDTGAIENGTAWIDATLRNINIDNQAPGPVVGILLQGTSSGSMHNVHIRIASGTTYLTAANDMQFFNCLGVGVDAAAGDIIGDIPDASIEGKIDAIQTELSGTAGIATWKTGAEAANGVSLSEALRFISDALLGTVGLASFPASVAPANDVNLAEVIRELFDQMEKGISGSDAVMVNGDTIFTIAGGPIEIMELVSECITVNDGTASTLQYTTDPTVGIAVTISAASASLAAAAAGSGVVLNQTALNTAPDLIDPLVGLSSVNARNVIVGAGVIKIVIGTGSTTGTWRHHLRYRPLRRGVTVTAA